MVGHALPAPDLQVVSLTLQPIDDHPAEAVECRHLLEQCRQACTDVQQQETDLLICSLHVGGQFGDDPAKPLGRTAQGHRGPPMDLPLVGEAPGADAAGQLSPSFHLAERPEHGLGQGQGVADGFLGRPREIKRRGALVRPTLST